MADDHKFCETLSIKNIFLFELEMTATSTSSTWTQRTPPNTLP